MSEEQYTVPIGVVKHAQGAEPAVHAVNVHENGRVAAICRVFRQGMKLVEPVATLDHVTCRNCKKQLEKGRRPSIRSTTRRTATPHPRSDPPPAARVVMDRVVDLGRKLDALEELLHEDMLELATIREELEEGQRQLERRIRVLDERSAPTPGWTRLFSPREKEKDNG